MEILRVIRQRDIEPGYAGQVSSYKERLAARAVLRDEAGRIALLHAAQRNYYKLPGGGVEQGEDMALALARELLEEVGAVAEVTGEIGRVEEWREREDGGLYQVSDAYAVVVSGPVGEPDFTESELAEGFSVVWANDIDEAVRLVEVAKDHPNTEVRFMVLRDATILKRAKE